MALAKRKQRESGQFWTTNLFVAEGAAPFDQVELAQNASEIVDWRLNKKVSTLNELESIFIAFEKLWLKVTQTRPTNKQYFKVLGNFPPFVQAWNMHVQKSIYCKNSSKASK